MSSFQIGDRVLVRNGSSARFERRGEIVDRVHSDAWRIQFDDGIMRVVNQRFMRKFEKLVIPRDERVCDGESLPISKPSAPSSYSLRERKLPRGFYREQRVKL